MKIKDVIEEFATEDFSEWGMVRNRNNQALWLRRNNSCLKVHVRRDSDDQYIVKLYRFQDLGDFSGMNYRITIIPEGIELCTLEMNKDQPDEVITINDYRSLESEDSFFQQSLVQDMGDLECSHIETLIYLNYLVIERTKGHI